MSDTTFVPPTPPLPYKDFMVAGTAFAAQAPGTVLRNNTASSGTPLQFAAAKADSLVDNGVVTGLAVLVAAALGDEQLSQFGQRLTLSAAQWQAVTDEALAQGLVAGDTYYLSATNAGKMTHTAPVATGTFQQAIGVAESDLTLLIRLGTPIGPHA